MVVPLRLVFKNMFSSPLVTIRTLLTLASLVVAIFLLCFLRAIVGSLTAGVEAAASNRMCVQSAVSLFVDLPISYQVKIEAVDGVDTTTKFQWFGGFYQDPSNFFAQFGIDHDRFLDTYPEVKLLEGDPEAFRRNRTGCLIGADLKRRFGWGVGDRIPLIGTIFPRSGGEAWQFQVEGVYRSTSANVDNNTMFFHFDYLNESLESGVAHGPKGVGVFVVRLKPGASPEGVASTIDGLFINGPQRVQTTSEAEFQRQFVSMVGSVPTFIASIGAGVLFAIILAVLNTMLMAGRERTQDLGILKALGFTDATAFVLLLSESLLLCLLGGLLGVGLASVAEPVLGKVLSMFFPGFAISGSTMLMGIGVSLGIGVLAGVAPAWRASRLRCVEALRSEA